MTGEQKTSPECDPGDPESEGKGGDEGSRHELLYASMTARTSGDNIRGVSDGLS